MNLFLKIATEDTGLKRWSKQTFAFMKDFENSLKRMHRFQIVVRVLVC